jgi:hypothetical protein
MKRISDKVFEETKCLEDLVNLMAYSEDGRMYADVGDPKQFIYRYQMFKERLKKELPEFTNEEILKFDEYFHKFKDTVYVMGGYDRMLTCLEYEERLKIK